MRNYINRFTSLLRQVMAMETSFGMSALGRTCDAIKEAQPDRQASLLDALASRFALTRMRLIDPQTLKVDAPAARRRASALLAPPTLTLAGRLAAAERRAAAAAFDFTTDDVLGSLERALLLQPRGVRLSSLPQTNAQSALGQIQRVFAKDVLPRLRGLAVLEIARAHLLEVIGRIETRKSLSVAEKVRTWLGQFFDYATVVVPGLEVNPAIDLEVVAAPLPPVQHNPFLRLIELPAFLRKLRRYPGDLRTQLAVRLLLLTGVRTGELRHATLQQFDLERGLWIIPPDTVKQLKLQMRRKPSDPRTSRPTWCRCRLRRSKPSGARSQPRFTRSVSQGMDRCGALPRGFRSSQCIVQPRGVRRAASCDDAGLG